MFDVFWKRYPTIMDRIANGSRWSVFYTRLKLFESGNSEEIASLS
jgi:hypothetical protein